MFGCLVAGRLVQTNLQVVDRTKFVFILDEPTRINHLVIFLTGEKAFDEGYGASIYYNTGKLQASGSPWQFLGILSNEKPSAVFRVKQQQNAQDTDSSMEEDNDYGEIGISIESLSVVQALVQQNSNKLVPAQPSSVMLVQRLAENLFNYLSSFAKPASAFVGGGFDPVIPSKALQDWYNNTLRKLQNDPQAFNH